MKDDLHWYPRNPKDWLHEAGRLSMGEYGLYSKLVDFCWLYGGRLPDNEGDLRRMTGCERNHWPRFWARVRPFFQLITDDRGGRWWTHPRMTLICAEQERRADISRENGKKGGRPRGKQERLPFDEDQAKGVPFRKGPIQNGTPSERVTSSGANSLKTNGSQNPEGFQEKTQEKANKSQSQNKRESSDSLSLLTSQGRHREGRGRYSIDPGLDKDRILQEACEAVLGASIGDAAETQDAVAAALESAGFEVTYEVPVPDRGDGRPGRLDLVASKGAQTIAFEIDRFSVRQKSIRKLQSHQGRRVAVLRQAASIDRPSELDALVVLRITEGASPWPMDAWDQFIAAYPNKVGLGGANGARSHFQTIAAKYGDRIPFDDVLEGARRYAETATTSRYLNPSRWLSEERWRDQPAEPPKTVAVTGKSRGGGFAALAKKRLEKGYHHDERDHDAAPGEPEILPPLPAHERDGHATGDQDQSPRSHRGDGLDDQPARRAHGRRP